MEPLLILAVTFVLLWVLFILPQQRRVRAHQALVASLEPDDEVILSAGIYGRIVDLDAEEMTLRVADGVELRVARQAVLRKVEDATEPDPSSTPRRPGPTTRDRPRRSPTCELMRRRSCCPSSSSWSWPTAASPTP